MLQYVTYEGAQMIFHFHTLTSDEYHLMAIIQIGDIAHSYPLISSYAHLYEDEISFHDS